MDLLRLLNRLLAFAFENPIVLFVLAAWLFGAVGSALRKAKGRAPGQPPPLPGRRAAPPANQRTADEIAREMRRILGVEDPEDAAPARPAPKPAPKPVPKPARREVVAPERPPAPVQPGAQLGKLTVQVAPHVGEAVQRRQAPASGKVGQEALGTLGGRTAAGPHRRRRGARLVDLSSLKRAFVVSEILGRPLGLR
ncbi:MAG: hypothetical protein FJ265_14405 [Planctomycetes bacterium]|nr:hypothetical protein [Planctomycetota bacterium]